MSLMVSWLAGQVRRLAGLFAGDGEAGLLAGVALALAAVDGVPEAPAGAAWVQLVLLAAMTASRAARAAPGTRTMITSVRWPPFGIPAPLKTPQAAAWLGSLFLPRALRSEERRV